MAGVLPFRALRYDPAKIDLASVICPPYDVIDADAQERLYSRALQNLVRVELGKDFPGDEAGSRDRYTRARDHLQAWRELGFLIRDGEPSLYLHRHHFSPPGSRQVLVRTGIFAGVVPVPHERREVLRHELTMDGPKQDRVRLLQATGVQASPILLLYDDRERDQIDLPGLLERAERIGEAVVEGEQGEERHALFRLTDRGEVSRVTGLLSASHLYIADGHHRYETALALRLPATLALLSPLHDPANVVLATHRILCPSPTTADQLLTSLAGAGWDVETCPSVPVAEVRIRELASDHHAFVILDSSTVGVASRRRQRGLRPPAGLDVTVLDREIMEAILGVSPQQAAAGRLRYSRDVAAVASSVQERGALGILLNPTSVDEMAAAALAGEALPQKSTYFFPKVPAGLVILESR